jgi:hypothetical protein
MRAISASIAAGSVEVNAIGEKYIPREVEPSRAFTELLPLFYHSAMA